jgi:Flp pilus assembly protein TadG
MGRRLRAFRRDQNGVAAVEFGLVAVPFFALLFAIIETAVVFWTSQALETAVAAAARTVYTGKFQNKYTSGDIGKSFKKEVCDRMTALLQCTQDTSTVHVDVRVVTATIPAVVKNGEIDPSAFIYQKTQANDLVLVRVAVEYPIFSSLLNPNQASLKNGKRLIMGTATFRNEPF